MTVPYIKFLMLTAACVLPALLLPPHTDQTLRADAFDNHLENYTMTTDANRPLTKSERELALKIILELTAARSVFDLDDVYTDVYKLMQLTDDGGIYHD